jgi:hypothetical protein
MNRLPILMIAGTLGLVLAVAPATGHKPKKTHPADSRGGKSTPPRPPPTP